MRRRRPLRGRLAARGSPRGGARPGGGRPPGTPGAKGAARGPGGGSPGIEIYYEERGSASLCRRCIIALGAGAPRGAAARSQSSSKSSSPLSSPSLSPAPPLKSSSSDSSSESSSSMSPGSCSASRPPGPCCACLRLAMRRPLAWKKLNRFCHSPRAMPRNWCSVPPFVVRARSKVLELAECAEAWRRNSTPVISSCVMSSGGF